jgi:transcription elongation factor Elf1
MPQPKLKQDYVVMTVSCGSCQQEQLVHVHARTGTWSMAHQSVECLRCGQYFEVIFPTLLSAVHFFRLTSPRHNKKATGAKHSQARRFFLRTRRLAPRKLNPLRTNAIVPGSGVA